jgi:hypothetical protein
MHVELVQVVLMNTVTTHISQHAFRITTIYILTVYCSALAWSMLVMLLPIVPNRLLINGLAWYLSVIHNKQSSHSPWWPSRLGFTIIFLKGVANNIIKTCWIIHRCLPVKLSLEIGREVSWTTVCSINSWFYIDGWLICGRGRRRDGRKSSRIRTSRWTWLVPHSSVV